MPEALSYKKSGVDIYALEILKQEIKKKARKTYSKNVLGGIGGFAGLFALDKKYINPVIVSSIDGVGTKLKIAFLLNKHDTVGQDLVNHCVNDILVCGAKPLFFLDYISSSTLPVRTLPRIISGISRACLENNCVLIGGESALMPGFYKEREYDLAGCIVGAVEKEKLIDGSKIQAGDLILGLGSSGLHTNGYSLVRKIFLEQKKYSLNQYFPALRTTIGQELLKIHLSYLKSVSKILVKYEIKGMAHITGGGIAGNLVRVLPDFCQAEIDTTSWARLPIFDCIQKEGQIETSEMYRVFNMGIGFILIVGKKYLNLIIAALRKLGEKVYLIGEIKKGLKTVKLRF